MGKAADAQKQAKAALDAQNAAIKDKDKNTKSFLADMKTMDAAYQQTMTDYQNQQKTITDFLATPDLTPQQRITAGNDLATVTKAMLDFQSKTTQYAALKVMEAALLQQQFDGIGNGNTQKPSNPGGGNNGGGNNGGGKTRTVSAKTGTGGTG
ncbi:MAG: hypothetical protein J2P17_17420, partial [Mycobacterium sp.]|nr:hypothetical protein [Mycobacterium sp.]